jgi:cephalosporin-C deacetylase-like acetyl esterase
MSSANSFLSVVVQMGMGMGVAVGAVALRLSAWMHSQQTGVPTLSDFHVAFALVSVIAVLAVFDCFGLDRNAGAEVSGHGA